MLDMPEAPKPDQDSPDSLGVKPSRARSLANLRPAWTPETAPRAGGRAPDGGGTKDHPIRATLRKQLAKRRNLRRLVDAWIESAIGGDSAAREQILKRLDPVLDDPTQGRTILEGLKLELREGKASVTLLRGVAGPSDAERDERDSCGGERRIEESGSRIEASEPRDVLPEIKESSQP